MIFIEEWLLVAQYHPPLPDRAIRHCGIGVKADARVTNVAGHNAGKLAEASLTRPRSAAQTLAAFRTDTYCNAAQSKVIPDTSQLTTLLSELDSV